MEGRREISRRNLTAALIGAAVGLALAPGAALAGLTVEPEVVPGANAPGPAEYDQVYVSKVGPSDADRVLVLMPGTSGGAGDFTLLAEDLVAAVPDLQVWSVDRREQALEDTSKFEEVAAGTATPQDAFDYYLNWIVSSVPSHYQPLDPEEYDFTERWGLRVALRDVREVVKLAREDGREVYLGGHSLGASAAAAYAAWNFDGRAGYRDIEGLVLIDGGLQGTFDSYTRDEAETQLLGLPGSPWADLLGLGLPWAAGAFAESGAWFAREDPTGASALQDFPLLPAAFKPTDEVTNRGLLGYAFDKSTSPPALALIQVRAGELGPLPEPRDWADGEVTPIARLAETFGQEPANAVEWYFPKRLSIDVNGANALRRNAVARFLNLPLRHGDEIDVPLLAIQTDLTQGGVLEGAKNLIRSSEIPRNRSVLINAEDSMSHLDPLTAAPALNPLVQEMGDFLDGAG